MKKIDITSQISGIDPKYLDEALTYRAPRFNKIKIIALAACLAIIVTAIPLSLIMNREDPVQTPDTTLTPGKDSTTDSVIVDPHQLKVIYCDADSVSPQYLEANLFKDKNIKVESFKSYRRPVEWKEEYETIPRSEDIPEKLTLSLSNKEYTANFDIAYNVTSNSNDENLKKLDQIARYKMEKTENRYVYYCIATKTIVSIDKLPIDSTHFLPLDIPKYTIEEIEELAHRDIKSIFGEKIIEKYSTIFSAKLSGFFMVGFKRMIGDYDTGSEIVMTYTLTGELFTCDVEKFEKYYFAEHLLNEKKLLEVEKEAQELIGENLVCEKKLMLHKDGYVCVRYILYIGDDERGSPRTVEIYFRLE